MTLRRLHSVPEKIRQAGEGLFVGRGNLQSVGCDRPAIVAEICRVRGGDVDWRQFVMGVQLT